VSITCFCLLIGGGLFPASGVPEPTTTWFEIVLFLVGIGLISIEILLVPGVAVFAILGSILCFGSLVMAVVPSTSLPGGEQLEFRDAILLITAGVGSSMIAFFAVLRFLPDKLTGGMVTTTAIRGVPDADSAEESRQKNARLMGKSGICITPLRPAGTIEIEGGESLDVIAVGEFINKGEKVTIEECSSTRIVVSRTEPTA
jgi:membrane-bound serine protease (ClpP class)